MFRASIFSTWYLFLNQKNMKIIIPEIKSPVQRGMLACVGTLFFSIPFLLSVLRSASHLPQNFFFFLTFYTQEVFPIQIIMMIAWYVTGIKSLDNRRDEYMFLSGLPLTAKQIFTRFFVSDLFRFIWIPAINSVLFIVLIKVSSVNYVAPLAIFSFVSFVLCCALLHWLHLRIPGVKASTNYLRRYNPLPLSIILPLYMISNIIFLRWNNEFNALVFCMIILVMSILSLVLLQAAARRFQRLDRQNYWLKQRAGNDIRNTAHRSVFRLNVRALFTRLNINPLLYRNWRQSQISSTSKLNNLLILVFISLAYLVSRNNEHADDMISVLQGIMLIFYAIYSYTVLNKLDPSIESPALIYSLPIAKRDFYLSVYTPPFFILMLINTLIAVWLFSTTHLPGAIVTFWCNSSAGIILWLTTSVNCGVANYPDMGVARKKLLCWYFVYMILGAIFFKYFWITLLILFMLTFVHLMNIKLYYKAKK